MRSFIMIIVALILCMLTNVMADINVWESEDPDASDLPTSPARYNEYTTRPGQIDGSSRRTSESPQSASRGR